jgi:hypothetical protein
MLGGVGFDACKRTKNSVDVKSAPRLVVFAHGRHRRSVKKFRAVEARDVRFGGPFGIWTAQKRMLEKHALGLELAAHKRQAFHDKRFYLRVFLEHAFHVAEK